MTIPKNRGHEAIFSLPQTNQYQVVSSLVISNLDNPIIKNIEGNKVGIFTLNDVTKNIEIKFQQIPKAINKSVDDVWSITDYKNKALCTDPQIKKIVRDVIGKEKNLHQIISKLYYFALDYLTYGRPIDGLYTYKQAMEEKTVDCGGYATFLMSLFQSQGIPTRFVSGFIINDNLFQNILSRFDICHLNFDILLMHAWLEAQLPDKSWIPFDPSIEWRRSHGLTKRSGGFGHIPADRLVISFGHDFKLKLNGKTDKIEILQKPIFI